MSKRQRPTARHIVLVLLAAVAVACGGAAAATPAPAAGPPGGVTGAAVPGIVDPANFGWPRLVDTGRGAVEIKEKPKRVLTPSLGHSEVLVSLVDGSRIAGVSRFLYDPELSNMTEFAATIPGRGTRRDAEHIVSLHPDLVIVDAFTPPEFMEQLEGAGMTVVQTQTDESMESIADYILLIAYMVGEWDRGVRLVEEVRRRLEAVAGIVGAVPEDRRPRVLMLGYQSKWTGGAGSYDEEIITRAGGINLPSAEFAGYKEIGDEAVVAMNPEVLLLSASEVRKNDALNLLSKNPALAQVDAIKSGRVFPVEGKFLGNLSHWRVRGVEEVAKLLYPDRFGATEFPDFQIGVE